MSTANFIMCGIKEGTYIIALDLKKVKCISCVKNYFKINVTQLTAFILFVGGNKYD